MISLATSRIVLVSGATLLASRNLRSDAFHLHIRQHLRCMFKPRSSLDHASARNCAAVVTATQSHATRIIELLVCWLHWNIRLRAVSDVEFGGTK